MADNASLMNTDTFIETIYQYYALNKRPFAWRDNPNTYHVFVSEVMLQQTQTSRVVEKFDQFIKRFSTFHDLASAPLVEVLATWQGLGYNRRGKFLHEAAQMIMEHHAGVLPDQTDLLETLPGIGPATAASVAAFAYNKPTVFIETNIRTVFIHFFFHNRTDVHDKEIMPLIEKTLDRCNSRQWYYALMDYGVMLKKTMPNPSRRSKHHAQQSKFEGSDRQIRGAIVRLLTTTHASISQELLVDEICIHPAIVASPERVYRVLEKLIEEHMVQRHNDLVFI